MAILAKLAISPISSISPEHFFCMRKVRFLRILTFQLSSLVVLSHSQCFLVITMGFPYHSHSHYGLLCWVFFLSLCVFMLLFIFLSILIYLRLYWLYRLYLTFSFNPFHSPFFNFWTKIILSSFSQKLPILPIIIYSRIKQIERIYFFLSVPKDQK